MNQKVVNYKTFADTLKTILRHDTFLIKFSRYQIKIITNNSEDYDKLVLQLDSANTDFQKFIKIKDRHKKIIIKAAPNMDVNDIIADLSEMNNTLMEWIPLWSRFPETRFYLLTLPSTTQIIDIRKIDKVNNVIVS